MSQKLIDGRLVETKEIVIEDDCESLCRLREHYKKDIQYFTEKLAEVEVKICVAKQLGFEEKDGT